MQIIRIGDGLTELPSAETVGAKAANLARIGALGIAVPPAFALPVELCAAIARGEGDAGQKLSDGLRDGIAFLEQTTGKRFGDRRRPLLVSVRSGAARSMPGMLDTVLDVGCTLPAVCGLIRTTGHPRFAWDCRRRFLESYANTVLGSDSTALARRLAGLIAAEGAANVQSLDGEATERIAGLYQQTLEDNDQSVPDDPIEQLETAAQAVYRSWTSGRAQTYRQLMHLEDLQGTAVTVQAMVFGNRGLSSGAGVAFSRDPSTGSAQPVIDVLFDSQGEDVVSGGRTPETEAAIARSLPQVAIQLRTILARLEREFGDVQDVEFTIEDGKLWILQARSAKRTPLAALRFAVDFVKQGLITPEQGLQRLSEVDFDKLAHQHIVAGCKPIAGGAGASVGIAIGRATFDSNAADRLAANGDPVILIRHDTSTADVDGFAVSAGIVTAVGGRTAHAALVARQMGKPCVVGCAELRVDGMTRSARFGGISVKEGDWLSIDGEVGNVYLGRCNVTIERPEAEIREVERWRNDTSKTHIDLLAS